MKHRRMKLIDMEIVKYLDSFSGMDVFSSSRNNGISGKDWSRLQLLAWNRLKWSGSSGNDWSILQFLKSRYLRHESCLIAAGKLSKLFPRGFKFTSDDRQPILQVNSQGYFHLDSRLPVRIDSQYLAEFQLWHRHLNLALSKMINLIITRGNERLLKFWNEEEK